MSNYVRKDWHCSEDHNHRLAAYGEDIVAKYLKDKMSMNIVGRNVRFSMGEIDIVAVGRGMIWFVEVKTRSSLKYGVPSLSITKKKQWTLKTLALSYLKYHRQYEKLKCRIDVAEVLVMDGNVYMRYIPSAIS